MSQTYKNVSFFNAVNVSIYAVKREIWNNIFLRYTKNSVISNAVIVNIHAVSRVIWICIFWQCMKNVGILNAVNVNIHPSISINTQNIILICWQSWEWLDLVWEMLLHPWRVFLCYLEVPNSIKKHKYGVLKYFIILICVFIVSPGNPIQ